jgi:hypothetical protein
MSNVLQFPTPQGPRQPLVRDLSPEERMQAQMSNAMAALMLSLEDDNIALGARSMQRDLEIVRNVLMGALERDGSIASWRVLLLDEIQSQIG